MGKGYRQGRLAEEIRKIVSEMLLRELKDPRLPAMVTVAVMQPFFSPSLAAIRTKRSRHISRKMHSLLCKVPRAISEEKLDT
jgi:hypothetical protein